MGETFGWQGAFKAGVAVVAIVFALKRSRQLCRISPLLHCSNTFLKCLSDVDCREALQCAGVSVIPKEGPEHEKERVINLTNWVPCCYPHRRQKFFTLTTCLDECFDIPLSSRPDGGVLHLPKDGRCLHPTPDATFSPEVLEGSWYLTIGMTDLDNYDCQRVNITHYPPDERDNRHKWHMHEWYRGNVKEKDGKLHWKEAQDFGNFTATDTPGKLFWNDDRPYVVLAHKPNEYVIYYYCAALSPVRREDSKWWTSVIMYSRRPTMSKEALQTYKDVARKMGYGTSTMVFPNNHVNERSADGNTSFCYIPELDGPASQRTWYEWLKG
ncbi:unnamed protein product [Vitrella brassicaformis CCMP3155]|uniref:VDE lipocalin domain-containing protein n=1 Tax=Vitrella brassicaformis (strain CCMP3155) TaxID=1169540 RepID=A0A0G4F686_VITBC|nr:unnamed protein product [Vitrella brassicaformis CCMP3155]|eukprot:CEM07613.1 unnamed protein product [Vitrella brassicaformis CCMP3155]